MEEEDFLDDYHAFVSMCPQPQGRPPVDEQFMKGYWAASQMATESAEVLELFEKSYRKDKPIDLDKLEDELGDVMWGLTCIANTYGISLSDVIHTNIQKLSERHNVPAF